MLILASLPGMSSPRAMVSVGGRSWERWRDGGPFTYKRCLRHLVVSFQLPTVPSCAVKKMSFLRLCATQWRGSGIAGQVADAPASAPVEEWHSKFSLTGLPALMTVSLPAAGNLPQPLLPGPEWAQVGPAFSVCPCCIGFS